MSTKAEAFKRLCGQLIDYSDESVEAICEFERACIAEAVAPALEYLTKLRNSDRFASDGELDEMRRLLTEGME